MIKVRLVLLTLLVACAPVEYGRDLSADAVAAMLKSDTSAMLVDVRTPEEYAEGHLRNSTLMDYYRADIHDRLRSLPKDRSVVLYCRSGRRSADAKHYLDSLGYTRVFNMLGGIVAWQEHNHPVEQ